MKIKPRGYDEFRRIAGGNLKRPPNYFSKNPAEDNKVFRFTTRYTIASSIANLEAKDFTASTSKGYLSLIRVAMSYSAIERFVELSPSLMKQEKGKKPRIDHDKVEELFRPYVRDIVSELKKLKSSKKFFEAVEEIIEDPKLKKKLAVYQKGNNEVCISTLARAIRHAFFHGELAANPRGVTAPHVTKICDAIAKSVLEVLSEEFGKRALHGLS
jgi:hypothetical protein